ncbi:hypothetical protein U5922_011615 [Aquicoccus sp. G2-2]|uniref:hypothetical protein n=1 Tax=Aquicoccus sp. G2-2 TaxID=3092120 RepID=UPI002ADF088B|nr:hypothetical protein [Aquicoccus sp. G2-2]MEA1114077.1 hypothetical protein [Aquicoccus sp. G2-2]
MKFRAKFATSVLALAAFGAPVLADGSHAIEQEGAVRSDENAAILADTDILAAHVHRDGGIVTFHMTTRGVAGVTRPDPVGKLAGAGVQAYVWPVSLDPSAVGFEGKSGILALVATAHPDFDDTPLFDENRDGDLANDGADWHSHWVVLAPTEACGEGALAVRDILEGETPKLPATWPGLPLYIDSPGYSPVFDGPEIKLNVPLGAEALNFDGVTAALRVNADLHTPLLCVTDVFDVASGDLSLPGRLE